MKKEEMKESGITINEEILKAMYVINKNAKIYRDIANKLYRYISSSIEERISIAFTDKETEILSNNDICIDDIATIDNPASYYYEQVKNILSRAPHDIELNSINIRELNRKEKEYKQEMANNISETIYDIYGGEIMEAFESIYEIVECEDMEGAKNMAEELKRQYINEPNYISAIDDMLSFIDDDIEMCNMFSECRNILEYIKDNHIVDSWRQAHQFIAYLSATKKSLYDCKDKVLDKLNIKPMEYHRFEVDDNHVYAYYIIGGFRFHLPVIDNGQPITKTITGNIDSDYDDTDMPTIDEAIAILDNELDITYNGPSSVSDMQYDYSKRGYTYNNDIYDYDGGDDNDYGDGGDYDNGDD